MQINIKSKIKDIFSRSTHLSTKSFTVFRFLFGAYFAFYAFRMLPFANEIYGQGMLIYSRELSWLDGLFPSITYLCDSSPCIYSYHLLIILFGVSMSFGFLPRLSAIILYYFQTSLYVRNPLTEDPSMFFVGLLLITIALIPDQPKFKFSDIKYFNAPIVVFYLPIISFCTLLTVSALDKAVSLDWQNGSAFREMLNLHIAREYFLVNLLKSNMLINHFLSYAGFISQLITLPLLLIGKYKWAILLQIFAFCFALLVFDLNQVILGMLFVYSWGLLSTSKIFCIKKTDKE